MDIKNLPKTVTHKGKEYCLSVEYGRYGREWYLCYKYYWEHDDPSPIHECFDVDLIQCMLKLKELITE